MAGMRIAPVPKVAGGTTIGGLVAYGLEVAVDYGWDIKPSLAAWVVLLTTFTVAWLIPSTDGGPSHGLTPYPQRSLPDADLVATPGPQYTDADFEQESERERGATAD